MFHVYATFQGGCKRRDIERSRGCATGNRCRNSKPAAVSHIREIGDNGDACRYEEMSTQLKSPAGSTPGYAYPSRDEPSLAEMTVSPTHLCEGCTRIPHLHLPHLHLRIRVDMREMRVSFRGMVFKCSHLSERWTIS